MSKGFGSISFYAYTVTFNTILIIATGIFFVWTLFHGDKEDKSINKCLNNDDSELKGLHKWVCTKGFDVIRIVIVILFVIIWIFQIGQYPNLFVYLPEPDLTKPVLDTVGIFIVFDYRGQLMEEQELEDSERAKSAPNPNFVITAPAASQPQMRTTYDAQPYDSSTNGWASAKSPYAFNQPNTAQVGGR